MSAAIDEGEIIAQRNFDAPVLENNNIAPLYSSHIRSILLIEILKEFQENKMFNLAPDNRGDTNTFFKMHPALTNLVFYKLNNQESHLK